VSEKAIRKLVEASKPAESAQLAFAGMTTAATAAAPPAAVPAKSTNESGCLRAISGSRRRSNQRGCGRWRISRKLYGEIGPAFYGLHTPLALLRIKRARPRAGGEDAAAPAGCLSGRERSGDAPHYARVDQEGRTLLHELFAATGDIRVSDTELHITLPRSPRTTKRFSVRPPPRIGLAFPGSPIERSNATAVPQAP
jgi:hypothetical protein